VAASPFTIGPDGLRVAVRLTPKASADRIQGVVTEADGRVALKVQVTAVPEDGKANAALIRLLAKQWRLPRTTLDVVQGATDRRKLVRISGEGEALRLRLEQGMTDSHD
jgi:uncharacterized protein (TIGR00251 family)